MYIPPQGTKYAPEDPYLQIQEELYKYSEDNRHILLFWDFNSRYKNLPDLIKSDEYISDIHGMQDVYAESNVLFNLFDKHKIPLGKKKADDCSDGFGNNLLDMCRNNDLFIFNGRVHVGSEYIQPRLTYKNKSSINYFIGSAYFFLSL